MGKVKCMTSNWNTERIAAVANVTDFVANGSFESLRNNVTYRSEPDHAILIRLVDYNAGWNGNYVYVDQASFSFLKKSVLLPGDIIIANVGANAGTVFRVPELEKPMTLGPNAILCQAKEGVLDRDFLYYYLTGREGQESIASILGGSAQPKFNKTDFRSLYVPVPPMPEQKSIGKVLKTLDDKIELNRRMSATLEEMARALFKSWFIDFDPVHAKAQGRPTNLPPEIEALFPESFEDSELDPVPKGWDVRPLDSLGTFLNGLALQKYPPVTANSLPVIKIAQLRKMNTSDADRCGDNLPSDYVVKDGDILFSWSGSLECVVWTGGNGGLNQHLFKVTSNEVPDWFLFFAIHEHLPWFRRIAASKATTMGHIQRKHLSEATIAFNQEVIGALDSILEPIFRSMWGLQLQSQTLASVRDSLLPKLISGEISVGTDD